MAEMILVTKVDHQRPTLKIKAVQDKISPKGMAAFFATHAVPLLQHRAEERFLNEGDETVGRWKPLAPATVARREKAGQVPLRINRRTGAMMDWVTNSPGRVITTKGDTILEWPGTASNKTTSRKLKTAQTGKGSPYTPPRPVIGVGQEDLFTIITLLESWVDPT